MYCSILGHYLYYVAVAAKRAEVSPYVKWMRVMAFCRFNEEYNEHCWTQKFKFNAHELVNGFTMIFVSRNNSYNYIVCVCLPYNHVIYIDRLCIINLHTAFINRYLLLNCNEENLVTWEMMTKIGCQ